MATIYDVARRAGVSISTVSYLDGLTLRAFPASGDGVRTVTVTDHVTGAATRFAVERRGGDVEVSTEASAPWRLEVVR